MTNRLVERQSEKVKLRMTTRPADLASRAMLVQLSVGQWTARKLDKKVTADVAAQAGAGRDAGRYNKALLARGALASVAAVVAQARADHAFLSLPWLQDGTRIIPVDAYAKYAATMQRHREKFESEVRNFIAGYDDYIDDARRELGALFNAADYPAKGEVARRFGWRVNVLPMPSAADFRVDLDKSTVAALQADMQADIHDAIDSAMRDVYSRIETVTRAMAEKLSAYRPELGKQGNPFRDSLVENVRALLDVLPSLNVTGDARLSATIDAMRDKLASHDPDDLRASGKLRAETAKAAEQIADDMAAFMGA